GADRVAEGASAAVHVHLCVVEAEVVHGCHGDDGEGFVDLEQVNVVLGPARALQHLFHRADGCGGEPLRRVGVGGVGHDLRQRGQAARLGGGFAHQHQRRRAVGDGGGAGGGYRAVLGEGGAQLRDLVE